MAKNEQILIDPSNPTQNEFFRLKAIFSEITQNNGTSDAVMLKILVDRAIELYKYMQSLPTNIDMVRGLKYEPGKHVPSEVAMTIKECMRHADIAKETFHDYATAKENYRRIVEHYQHYVRQYSLYEPFFDSVIELVKKLEPRLNDTEIVYRKNQELQELLSIVDELRKGQATSDKIIEQMRKDASDVQLVWETATLEVLAEVQKKQFKYDIIMHVIAKPGSLGEQQREFLPLLTYAISHDRDSLSTTEIAQTLQDKDVIAAFVKQPWVRKTKVGGTYSIEWNLLSEISKNVEQDNRNDWLERIKVGVSKLAGKSITEKV